MAPLSADEVRRRQDARVHVRAFRVVQALIDLVEMVLNGTDGDPEVLRHCLVAKAF